jgi:hypothetical protein
MSLNKKSDTSRAERFKAFRDGAGAYRRGQSIGATPHLGLDAKTEVLRQSWVLGYSYARRARATANAAVVAAP